MLIAKIAKIANALHLIYRDIIVVGAHLLQTLWPEPVKIIFYTFAVVVLQQLNQLQFAVVQEDAQVQTAIMVLELAKTTVSTANTININTTKYDWKAFLN